MRRRTKLIATLMLPWLAAGCGQPDAEFVFRDETKALTKEARTQVEDAVVQAFGTPQDLVAWMKMPVDYGTIEGTVDEVVSATSVTIKLSDEAAEVAAAAGEDLTGCGLLWTSGDATGKGLQITGYDVETDTETRTLHVSAGEDKPAKGDTFVVVGFTLRSGRTLYMRHCMHCHGTTGDGAGPTAQYLNPLPRDYRLGIYKFTNIRESSGASQDDLHRLIKQGVPGTYMPSFMLLPDPEVHAITEYVRFLSMRGQFEQKLAGELALDFFKDVWSELDGDEKKDLTEEFFGEDNGFGEIKVDTADNVAGVWENAESSESAIVPIGPRVPDTKESREIGRQLFLSDSTKCADCHGVAGLGNGSQTVTKQIDLQTGEERSQPGLFDAWGQPVKPRNLTRGIYRGGRRPYDLYCRLASGIKGTPMAGFATALVEDELDEDGNPTGEKTDAKLWHLVNYILSVPHAEGLPAGRTLTKEVSKTSGGKSH